MSFTSETMREISVSLDLSGNYEDISLMRESPRGRIYTATRAGKRFILKAASNDGGKACEELKREYELSISLSHPALAYVFTYEEESPVGPCIVMEYVDGRSLRQWLDEDPTLAERKRVFEELLDAISYIHSKGVIHNDLSPENILITRSGNTVKLIDFGFADDDVHYLMKARGGTRSYASPELLSGLQTDARSDIYSLGCLMSDIFGKRYRSVSRKARSPRPEKRYPNAESLKRAWKGFYRPLYIILVSVTLAAVSFGIVKIVNIRKELLEKNNFLSEKNSVLYHDLDSLSNDLDSVSHRLDIINKNYNNINTALSRQKQAETDRSEKLAELKRKVDYFYATELSQMNKKMLSAPSQSEAKETYTQLNSTYLQFYSDLVNSCPIDLKEELLYYLTSKFNKDFPKPPAKVN